MRRKVVLLAATAASFVVVAVAAPVAGADYGNKAQYQAAISLNCDNKSAFFCTNVVGLGGLWSWFAFNNDGTFDSTETFCAHNDPVFGSGAFHFNGDGIWVAARAADPVLRRRRRHRRAARSGPECSSVRRRRTSRSATDGDQTWQDSNVPYRANQSMHYSFKGGSGSLGRSAQVSYIPNR